MRQLFMVGTILAAFLYSTAGRAQAMPLLGIKFGARERAHLDRLAGAGSVSEMLDILRSAHADLDLEELGPGDDFVGRFSGRFERGPHAVLGLQPLVTVDVVVHEFLNYLIDRLLLEKHRAQTLARGVSYRRWRRATAAQFGSYHDEAGRVTHLRHLLEGTLLTHAEEIEIALFLKEHGEALGVPNSPDQITHGAGHLVSLMEDWEGLFSKLLESPAASQEYKRFEEIGNHLVRAKSALLPCHLWI